MEMDLFANLTALSPPEDRRAAARAKMKKTVMLLSGAKERAAVSAPGVVERTSRRNVDEEDEQEVVDGDRSTDVSGLNESVSSMQCSADLTAFPGFQARIQSHDGGADTRDENGKWQMRLALDLGSSTKQHDFRPQGVSVSQLSQNTNYSQQNYAEIFYGDTQDEPEQVQPTKSLSTAISPPPTTATTTTTTTTREKLEPISVTRGGENKGVQRSPARAFLSSLENELNKRKQKNSTSDTSAKTTGALQSEPPVKTMAKTLANATDLPKTAAVRSNKSHDGKEFGRGPQFIRNMSTPPLTIEDDADNAKTDGDEYPTFTSFRENSITDSPLSSPIWYQFEPTTDPRDAETEPLVSSYEAKKEEDGAVYHHGRRDSIDSFPDTQSLGDAEMEDDDDVDMEATTRSYNMESKASDNEDNDDNEGGLPTQPSTSVDLPARTTTISPVQDTLASPARIALKKREKVTPQALPTLTDSVQKAYEFPDSSSSSSTIALLATKLASSASRNLAFSFAMPDSQESESQGLSSVPDAVMLASKALGATSDSDKAAAAPPKVPRKNDLPKTTVSATPAKKAKKAFNDTASTTGASSVESTPTQRKRKGTFVSPNVRVKNAPTPNGGGQEATPVRSKRIATKSNGSSTATPSSNNSTPSVRRTRAKLLSPLPSNRPYASRSKTIFKYKFEFCLTGFLKDGEESLITLIEGHGGKIAERYEDLLRKNNPKAVVVATPVSWRKRKFIYAIACGIPVVHPEWVHTCTTEGKVVPFDGFFVPSGYSITTRKFECLPMQQLDIFSGMSFGIPYDVVHSSTASVKDMSSLVAFVLKACGASHVIENLQNKQIVDFVLSDEVTETCEHYRRTHKAPVKNFSWVTECMILQRFVSPESDFFQPQSHDEDDESEQVLAAITEIGDDDRSTLKLHTGELVLADLTGNKIDHYMLCHVCEILRITIVHEDDDGKKRADGKQGVILEVGVLKRCVLSVPKSHCCTLDESATSNQYLTFYVIVVDDSSSPNPRGLSRVHSKILEIPASLVKGRVVAVSKTDFQAMKYGDESIFYYEEEDQREEGDEEDNDDEEEDAA